MHAKPVSFSPLLKKKTHEDLASVVSGYTLFLAVSAVAQEAGDKVVSVGQAADNAVQQSKLTLAGGVPFHLKAHIANIGVLKPEYSADVEEYWVSPEKWRRSVQSAGFSQTLIVNGDKVSEKLTGDYYPFWLHDMVTALFDPLPMVDQLKLMQGQMEIPEDSAKSNSCVNMQFKVGIAPAQNTVGSAFCFGGKGGLLQAVITPGYKAQFADYQPFRKKDDRANYQSWICARPCAYRKSHPTC